MRRSHSLEALQEAANTSTSCLQVKFGHGEWVVGSVYYASKYDIPLAIIIPAVIIPMVLFILVSIYCYR